MDLESSSRVGMPQRTSPSIGSWWKQQKQQKQQLSEQREANQDSRPDSRSVSRLASRPDSDSDSCQDAYQHFPQALTAPSIKLPPLAASLAASLAVDSIRLVSTWMVIPMSGDFSVVLEYHTGGPRQITVDILASSSGLWYGKGSVSVSSAGTATVSISCTVEPVQTYGGLAAGTEITLR